MGCFYVGYNWRRTVNGQSKIGETGKKTPAQRFAVIRQKEPFECVKYIVFENETKSERLFVESFVRMNLDRIAGYTQTKNDHFNYTITKGHKKEQAYIFANLAIDLAKQACEIAGIKYTDGNKKYKKG